MWKDPIVDELRKQRLKIELDCENNFNKIFEKAIETQHRLSNRVVSKPTSQRGSTKTVSEIR